MGRPAVVEGLSHVSSSCGAWVPCRPWMEQAGVPDSIRAAWCGHTVDVNRATYLHARPEDLAAARDALSRLYGATGS